MEYGSAALKANAQLRDLCDRLTVCLCDGPIAQTGPPDAAYSPATTLAAPCPGFSAGG